MHNVRPFVLVEHQAIVDEKMMQHEAGCRATVIPFILLSLFVFLAIVSQPAQSQTYKIIHNFTNKGSDGATPFGGPVLDHEGNLYGTTYTGGIYGSGSIYRLSPSFFSWKYTSLYSFKAGTDGVGPAFGTLALSPDGNLFGTTEGGGYFGTDFEISASQGGEVQIHRFGIGKDGAQPIGGVVLDSAGNLYGTTSLGGAYGNGTVYIEKLSGDTWTEKTIYSFMGGNDGENPPATVTLDGHGNIYGTPLLVVRMAMAWCTNFRAPVPAGSRPFYIPSRVVGRPKSSWRRGCGPGGQSVRHYLRRRR